MLKLIVCLSSTTMINLLKWACRFSGLQRKLNVRMLKRKKTRLMNQIRRKKKKSTGEFFLLSDYASRWPMLSIE